MEWKTAAGMKNGDTRERLKFAWLPEPCEDGITRWMCKIRVIEMAVIYMSSLGCVAKWNQLKAYPAEFEKVGKRGTTKCKAQ